MTDAANTKRKETDWSHIWVLIGAMASGGYLFAVLGIFLGAYHLQVIPASAISFIADDLWPFVCLGYIFLQIIPMVVRYQTQGWDVGIDQVSTIVAFMGIVVVLAGWGFGKIVIDAEGWKMFSLTLMTHLIDISLLLGGNKMIAAARGSEERAIH